MDTLMKDVERSVLSIAPENFSRLTEVFAAQKPKIVWNDRAKRLPSVDTSEKEIRIPILGAELLWSAAFMYWVLYSEYLEDQSEGVAFFNLTLNPRRVVAQLSFYTALARYNGAELARPGDFPSPEQTSSEDVVCANELFLAAIAWILHHELAHLHKGHTSITAHSRDEEREADLEATMWIFKNVPTEAMRKKRALGMVVAILLLTALDIETGNFDDSTHPKAFVRMDDCLEAAKLSKDHVVYAFVTLMIRVHLTISGHDVPETSAESTIKEIYSDHLYAVSRLQGA